MGCGASRHRWEAPGLTGFVCNSVAMGVKVRVNSLTGRSECVATPTDIDADLTFEIDGSAVTPERFQRTLTTFFDLLSEVTKAVAPEGERVEWRVQVKRGSNLVGIIPGQGVPPVLAANVRKAIVSGLERLEREPIEPPAFTERALTSVRRLASGLGTREDDDTIINVWGQQAAVLH